MQRRLNIATKAERQLWAALMRAWNAGHGACHYDLAVRYTQKYSDNVWGWVALADILVDFAHYKAAHHALSRAEKLAPAGIRRQICVQWGRFYEKSCELKRAEKWYRRGVECKATTTGLVFLGAVLAKQGRFSEAKRCHRRAARLATSSPDEAYYNLGLILRAERQYAKALDCFRKAIETDPEYEEAKQARNDVMRVLRLKGSG